MNGLWIVIVIAIVLLVGGFLIFKYAFPAVVEFHRDSLAPVRGLVGNPGSAVALASLL